MCRFRLFGKLRLFMSHLNVALRVSTITPFVFCALICLLSDGQLTTHYTCGIQNDTITWTHTLGQTLPLKSLPPHLNPTHKALAILLPPAQHTQQSPSLRRASFQLKPTVSDLDMAERRKRRKRRVEVQN